MTVLYKGTVHPWLCDVMGHMNVRHYMAAFDDASYQLLSLATGWRPAAEKWKGIGWADVEQHIVYKSELSPGDMFEVVGGITAIGQSSFTARYAMRNTSAQKDSATFQSKTVYFDLEKRTSMRLTDDLRARLESCKL